MVSFRHGCCMHAEQIQLLLVESLLKVMVSSCSLQTPHLQTMIHIFLLG